MWQYKWPSANLAIHTHTYDSLNHVWWLWPRRSGIEPLGPQPRMAAGFFWCAHTGHFAPTEHRPLLYPPIAQGWSRCFEMPVGSKPGFWIPLRNTRHGALQWPREYWKKLPSHNITNHVDLKSIAFHGKFPIESDKTTSIYNVSTRVLSKK